MEFHLITFQSLPSTQARLCLMAADEALAEGTVVWTNDQHSGYGQDGNHWESEPGKNLTFSVLFKPRFLAPAAQFLLNQAVALAVIDYLKEKDGITNSIQLKWPNDFYIGKHKTGGMILNNAVEGNLLNYSIAGIGLNINQVSFPESCPNPTSLMLETGRPASPEVELPVLLDHINTRYQQLKAGAIQQIQQDYLDNLFLLGIETQFNYLGKTTSGSIQGIDEFGRLLVQQKSGTLLCCDIKEIQYSGSSD